MKLYDLYKGGRMRARQRIRITLAAAVLILFGSSLFTLETAHARVKDGAEIPQFSTPTGMQKPAQFNLPGSMLSWIGTGNLTTYTISNTGQNGYFEPPPDWDEYDGEFPFGYTSDRKSVV